MFWMLQQCGRTAANRLTGQSSMETNMNWTNPKVEGLKMPAPALYLATSGQQFLSQTFRNPSQCIPFAPGMVWEPPEVMQAPQSVHKKQAERWTRRGAVTSHQKGFLKIPFLLQE